MADDRPLLYPVLRLKMDGKPEPQTGGGKGRASVVVERLAEQQRILSTAARNLYRDRGNCRPTVDAPICSYTCSQRICLPLRTLRTIYS